MLYILTVVIWGSTWIAINFQLGDVAAEASVTYRFAIAALILFSFCWLKKLPLKMTTNQHLRLAVFGISLFGLNYFLLYQAQQHINSALTCIAFSLLTLFNLINARVWYNTKATSQVITGSLLGLFGVAILFWPEVKEFNLNDATAFGFVLCLIGTMSASTGNMISIKNQKSKMPVMQSNAWGMAYGALFMAILTLVQGKAFTFNTSVEYIGSLLYLSVFGSVIAFGCYLSLMTRIGPHKTSYVNVLFPGIAVILSTLFEGFQWHAYTVIGFSCIILGNIIVMTKPNLKLLKPKLRPATNI